MLRLMTCQLGSCSSSDYRVTVVDRIGKTLTEVDFTQLSWERTLDAVSTATLQIPANCCGKLKDARTWRHELHISRDGKPEWAGPITVIANCRSGITLQADDVLQWLSRRVIHNHHEWAKIGAVQAARELLIDGYQPDDPNVLKHLTTFGTGVIGGREYDANSKYVLDALNDLAQGSLDYTTIGRRIILMPSGYELGRTTLLTCDHFQGDVCTTEDGFAAVTRGVVVGNQDPLVFGSYGGVDPYFGLLERLVTDDRIMSSDTAAGQARGLVNGANPPPLLVQPPNGSALAPSAPVCLSDLVPGVTVPVALDCTCRTAAQNMRLTKLSVTVDASGEKIAPLLTPIGLDGIS
jgi:hypothetical protein